MTFEELLQTIHDAAGGAGSVALIGALARNAWAPPRATADVDLAIVADGAKLDAVGVALRALGYDCVREQRTESGDPLPDMVVFRGASHVPRQVDLLVAKTLFEQQVLDRAILVAIGECEIPVASPEDLVVYKLLADRPRDRMDIRAVLATQERAGRRLDWSHVEHWARYWQITDRLERLRRELDF